MARTFRQLLLSILALVFDISQKEMSAGVGLTQSRISQALRRARKGEVKDDDFAALLATIPHPPAAVPIVTGCLEALAALEPTEDLTAADRVVIEEEALAAGRRTREELTEALRRARNLPLAGYPARADLEAARFRAAEQWRRLEGLPAETQLAVVQVAEELQTWALCEKVCAESVRQLARSLEPAADLARLAQEIAALVRGPEGWCACLQAYAMAHVANVLRVQGELKEARAALEEAKRLWRPGADPDGVLDPGRLLDLEGSLCRDERRFEGALALLDEALAVSHCPGRVLIKKGFTLEVMGEYERAAEVLRQAEPRIDRRAEPRNWSFLRLNLANVLCHLGRHREARELIEEVRPLMTELGDAIDAIRLVGLEGRIAAGSGQPAEARRLLAKARRKFAARGMAYDVALLALEELALLLEAGQPAEVQALAPELAAMFQAKGIHREALAALRLVHEATQGETATTDLARRALEYLYRARHDPSLRFSS